MRTITHLSAGSLPRPLGLASKLMYTYVRNTLQIPFYEGLIEHPLPGFPAQYKGRPRVTIGTGISKIYESVRSGGIHEVVMDCVRSIGAEDSASHELVNGEKTLNGIQSTYKWSPGLERSAEC